MGLQHPDIPNWATPKWNTKLKKNENSDKNPRKLKSSEVRQVLKKENDNSSKDKN